MLEFPVTDRQNQTRQTEAHCRQIDRCNQRGGRMLSIVDLIEAGTFPRDLAACCLAVIGGGGSFMVGALPGGAGKTTVMGALLNFVPSDVVLVPADGLDAIEQALAAPRCAGASSATRLATAGFMLICGTRNSANISASPSAATCWPRICTPTPTTRPTGRSAGPTPCRRRISDG